MGLHTFIGQYQKYTFYQAAINTNSFFILSQDYLGSKKEE